jgi:hypothetical protein
MILSTVSEFVRLKVIGLLFLIIAYLTEQRLTLDVAEDTASLSNDRRSLEVPFVFHGRKHVVHLPYNPYRIVSSDVKVYDQEDNLLNIHSTTCPGLEDFLFHPEALNHMYSGKVGKVVVESDDYDD